MSGDRPADAAALARELRSRLGDVPDSSDVPAVSIVVVSRDGAELLRTLLRGLAERTDYPSMELVVVDNGSRDDSLDVVRAATAPFPVVTVANRRNESFSDACNEGAARTRGELLLFLNNDTEPFEAGWLGELVACLRRPGVGIAGATLLERDGTAALTVQQRGSAIRDDAGVLRSAYRDQGADPLGSGLGVDVETASVSGACLAIERTLFEEIGGFTHGYVYGAEDGDLALKVRACGRKVVCSGRSLLIHAAGATLRSVDRETRSGWTIANRRLLWERWGPRIRREFELDRIAGRGVWAAPPAAGESMATEPGALASGSEYRSRAQALAVGFCLLAHDPTAPPRQVEALQAVGRELDRRGHRCAVLAGPAIDGLERLDHDVAVHLGGADGRAVNPAQLNVWWHVGANAARGRAGETNDRSSAGSCSQLVFAADPDREHPASIAERLRAQTLTAIEATAFPTRIPSEHGTGRRPS